VPAEVADREAELAREIVNPLAFIVTSVFQVNLDRKIGPDEDGFRVNSQAKMVIPFSLTEEWAVIARTIVPITYQKDVFADTGSRFGLGDISETLYFTPKRKVGGLILGAGPIIVFPTATSSLLGSEKWGIGPAFAVIRQKDGWTYGLSGNQIWSFAGKGSRASINSIFLQPFIAYTTEEAWTFSLQSEGIYDFNADQWSIPVTAAVAKVVRIGNLPVNLLAGIGYWADSPDNGPQGVSFRLQANIVFGKKN
jgi:hypothetical protein